MQDNIKAIVAALASVIGVRAVDDASGTAAPLVSVPKDFTVKSLEPFMPAPNRIDGVTDLHQYGAFVEYVNRYKSAWARIFVSPDIVFKTGGELAVAHLDYPGPDVPEWSTHSARLLVQPSLEYKLLTDLDSKLLSQDDFARMMLLLSRFCSSMSGADLLELAQRLTLTSKGGFRSFNDDFNGSVNFAYDVQVSAKVDSTATKTIEVPSTITFNMPMLIGGEAVSIVADFLYRIPEEPGGKINMGLRLTDRLYVERDLLNALVSQLGGDTNLPTAVGTSSVPTSPDQVESRPV